MDKDMPTRRKTKKKHKKLVILFYVVLLIALSIYTVKATLGNNKPSIVLETTNPEEINEVYRLSFIGLGDCLIHGYLYMDADTGRKGSDGYNIYDFKPMFSYVKEFSKGYDLKYYNQETIIGGKNLGLSGYPNFNSPDEVGDAMIDAGYNMVSLATNHAMDKGEKGILHSMSYWNSKTDVIKAGTYTSQAERDKAMIYEKNGIKFAFLNYTYGTNGINVPKSYLVNVWGEGNFEGYKKTIANDIAQVRDKVDIVMVAMHWGEEYQLGKTNNYQREAAKYLNSLGVDVIIGTHPHVVQPVEYVGDTLVIYSLGNMVSNQRYSQGLKGAIGGVAAFDIVKKVEDGKTTTKIENPKIDLVYTHDVNHKNYRVMPFSKLNNSILSNYQSVYAQYKAYLNPKNDSRIQVGFIN